MNPALNPKESARTVPCPACGGPSRYAPDNRYRPFCSARCRALDLGAWASERFRLDAQGDADDGSAPEAPGTTDQSRGTTHS